MVGFFKALGNIVTGRSMVGRGIHSAIGGIGSGLFGAAGGALGGKIFGIPEPKSAAQLGRDTYDYGENAFPGTNPWERLGSSTPVGSVESAKIGQVSQLKQMNQNTANLAKERENKRYIAELGAKTAVQTSQIGRGLGASGQDPDARFASDVAKMDANTKLQLQKALTEISQTKIKSYEEQFWAILKTFGLGIAGGIGLTKAYQILMGKQKVSKIPTPIPRGSPAPLGKVVRRKQPKYRKRSAYDRGVSFRHHLQAMKRKTSKRQWSWQRKK